MIEYLSMGMDLKHLALLFDDTSAHGDSANRQAWITRLIEHFRHLALYCLKTLPAAESLSFFYPEIQRVIGGKGEHSPLLHTMTAGLSRAEEDFTSLGSGLAVLGFPDFLSSPWVPLFEKHPFPGTGPRNVNFLLGYSGREEIVRAAEEVIRSGLGQDLDERDIDRHLLTRGQADPDLIIFSSREFTPGDFMIWQASYAEIWHSPLLGDDFTPGEVDRAMQIYEGRERRFGRV